MPIPIEPERRKRPPEEPDVGRLVVAGLLVATFISFYLVAMA